MKLYPQRYRESNATPRAGVLPRSTPDDPSNRASWGESDIRERSGAACSRLAQPKKGAATSRIG